MIITTRNGTNGRRIVRANRPSHAHAFGFSRIHDVNCLEYRAEGSDGKSYAIYLDAHDLEAIDRARSAFPQVEARANETRKKG